MRVAAVDPPRIVFGETQVAALCGDDDVVERTRPAPQRVDQSALVDAVTRSGRPVDVGGVEETDPGVERRVHRPPAAFHVVARELGDRHGPETYGRQREVAQPPLT